MNNISTWNFLLFIQAFLPPRFKKQESFFLLLMKMNILNAWTGLIWKTENLVTKNNIFTSVHWFFKQTSHKKKIRSCDPTGNNKKWDFFFHEKRGCKQSEMINLFLSNKKKCEYFMGKPGCGEAQSGLYCNVCLVV